jgi:hypothetical protein
MTAMAGISAIVLSGATVTFAVMAIRALIDKLQATKPEFPEYKKPWWGLR